MSTTTIIDPKNIDERNFIDFKGESCIIPHNSFVLARTVEYFKIPRNILTFCVGQIDIRPLRYRYQCHAIRTGMGRIRHIIDFKYNSVARQNLRQ